MFYVVYRPRLTEPPVVERFDSLSYAQAKRDALERVFGWALLVVNEGEAPCFMRVSAN